MPCGQSGVGALDAGRILDADYVASGSVRIRAGRLCVTDRARGDAHRAHRLGGQHGRRRRRHVLGDRRHRRSHRLGDRGRDRGGGVPPRDAEPRRTHWTRGKPIIAVFGTCTASPRADNLHAGGYFATRSRLDPMFARAYAGLSFTHFQNAFLSLTPDRSRQIELALETAGQQPGAPTIAIPRRTGPWAARCG